MVSLVAGHVGDGALALGLDEAEDLAVEIDGVIQVGDAQGHVSDSLDDLHAGEHSTK